MNTSQPGNKKSMMEKEEKMLRSYNEEFYSSLRSLKFLSESLPQNEKLLYRFEQNENASVSTTTGQLLSTYEELFANNENIKKTMKDLEKEIKELEVQLNATDDNVEDEFTPQIKLLSDALNDYMEKQKAENYRLSKEISLLEKEKIEIQQSIYNALGYLHKLEKEVGIKSKTYNYIYDQNLSENELSNKFDIQTENI